MLTLDEAVLRSGMKAREIAELQEVLGGTVMVTVAGPPMLWDGTAWSVYEEPLAAEVAEESEVVDVAAEADADADDPEEPSDDEADSEAVDVEDLRQQLHDLGVQVDKRWGVARLQSELAKAGVQ